MSHFKNQFIVFEKNKSKKSLLGVCSDPNHPDNVILTFLSSVSCYENINYSLLKSWVTKKDFEITCPAVFSPLDNELVFVLNHNILASISAANYEKVETFKLGLNIKSILPNEDKDPLIVFEDGSVYTVAHCMADPKEIKPFNVIDPLKDRLLFSTILKLSSETTIVCLLIEREDFTKDLLIEQLNDQNFLDNFKEVHLAISCQIFDTCVSSIIKDSEFLSIVSENGDIYSLNISYVDGSYCAAVKTIIKVQITYNPSIIPVFEGKLAIACKGNVVKVVGIQLGKVVDSLALSSRIKSVKLYHCNQTIYMRTAGFMHAYPYENEAVNLANVIEEKPVMKDENEEVDSQQESAVTESQEDFSAEASSVEEDENIMEDEWKSQNAYKTLFTSIDVDSFDNAWGKIWSTKNTLTQMQIMNSNELRKVLQRFDDDEKKTFWPRKTVMKMVQTGQLPGRNCNLLMAKVLAESDWEFVLNFLHSVVDVPEEILANIIGAIFKIAPEKLEVLQSDSSSILAQSVNTLLDLDYSELALKKQLQSLPINIVTNFMQYLLFKIKFASNVSKNPSLNSLLSWWSILLDSHLPNIVLMEDCWPIIESLQENVKLHLSYFNELHLISKFLVQINSKLSFHSKHEKVKYFVEVIEI